MGPILGIGIQRPPQAQPPPPEVTLHLTARLDIAVKERAPPTYFGEGRDNIVLGIQIPFWRHDMDSEAEAESNADSSLDQRVEDPVSGSVAHNRQ